MKISIYALALIASSAVAAGTPALRMGGKPSGCKNDNQCADDEKCEVGQCVPYMPFGTQACYDAGSECGGSMKCCDGTCPRVAAGVIAYCPQTATNQQAPDDSSSCLGYSVACDDSSTCCDGYSCKTVTCFTDPCLPSCQPKVEVFLTPPAPVETAIM